MEARPIPRRSSALVALGLASLVIIVPSSEMLAIKQFWARACTSLFEYCPSTGSDQRLAQVYGTQVAIKRVEDFGGSCTGEKA